MTYGVVHKTAHSRSLEPMPAGASSVEEFGIRCHTERKLETLALYSIRQCGAVSQRNVCATLLAVQELRVEVTERWRHAHAVRWQGTHAGFNLRLEAAIMMRARMTVSGPIGSPTLNDRLGLVQLLLDKAGVGTARLLVRITHCIVVEVNANFGDTHTRIVISEKGAMHK